MTKKEVGVALLLAALVVGVIALLRRSPEAVAPVVDARGSAPGFVAADTAPHSLRPTAPLISVDAAVPSKEVNTRATGKGEVVVRGGWGNAPGKFGRKREPESNPEAPMALVVGHGGETAILDQLNGRIQRFKDGKLTATIPISGETAQDLALAPSGKTLVLDRLGPNRNVQVYGDDGKLENEITLVGKGVPEGGGVTGVFADKDGVYVEREHSTLVRIGSANGTNDTSRDELPGRPTRDGRYWISAAMGDRSRGEILVRAFDREGQGLAWQRPLSVGAMILHLQMLDSDRHGNVYVAADTGRESPDPPFNIVDEAIVVARIGPGGDERGVLVLPAYPTPEETFRPLTVDDDGAVYMMVVEPSGFSVLRFAWP